MKIVLVNIQENLLLKKIIDHMIVIIFQLGILETITEVSTMFSRRLICCVLWYLMIGYRTRPQCVNIKEILVHNIYIYKYIYFTDCPLFKEHMPFQTVASFHKRLFQDTWSTNHLT